MKHNVSVESIISTKSIVYEIKDKYLNVLEGVTKVNCCL